MTRERILDWLAIAFFVVVYGGYSIYLATLYSSTGGRW